jgi:hypothetical protein
MPFAYPEHCCTFTSPSWPFKPLSYGACRDARDPGLCASCDNAKKRYLAARHKNRGKKRRLVKGKVYE